MAEVNTPKRKSVLRQLVKLTGRFIRSGGLKQQPPKK